MNVMQKSQMSQSMGLLQMSLKEEVNLLSLATGIVIKPGAQALIQHHRAQ